MVNPDLMRDRRYFVTYQQIRYGVSRAEAERRWNDPRYAEDLAAARAAANGDTYASAAARRLPARG